MSRRSPRRGSRLFEITTSTILLVIALGCLYPFVYIISMSLSDNVSALAGEVWLWPENLNFGAYIHILSNGQIGLPRAVFNSVSYTVVGTAFAVILTYFTAYALTRRKMAARHVIMFVFVAVWIFDAGLVPAYLVNEKLGLVDNWLVMVIPGALSSFLLIVTRSFLFSLPDELEESAQLDGANDFRIMMQVYLPLSKPVLATIGVFYAVQIWNSFLTPLIYLRDKALQPIQLVLYRLLVADDPSSVTFSQIVINGFEIGPQNIRAAVMVLAIVPIVALYPFAQRYFTQGMLVGSVKG
jgi:putative aldouronate transport system permease protein